MFRLAIVGTSLKLTWCEEIYAGFIIRQYLDNLKPVEVVSGGARGIDSIAQEEAEGAQIPYRFKRIVPQEYHGDNLARNRAIAKYADAVLCITTKRIQTGWCYHHTPWQNHQKTAGCYTGKYAVRYNKPFYLELV